MLSFRNLSIRHKLQGIILIVCGLALLLATAVFTFYERASFLSAKTEDLIVTAKMVGSNCTAALAFRDPQAARETLASLQAQPRVMSAVLYDAQNHIFAGYTRLSSAEPLHSPPPLTPRHMGISTSSNRLRIFQPVTLNGEVIGTIFIQRDLEDLKDSTFRFLGIDLAVLLGSLFVAWLLSLGFQRILTDPIRDLAATASRVTSEGDYSIRAVKHNEDEVGLLFDQFNGMLDRIQLRDLTIQKAHDDLEIRVQERTAYLNAVIENSPLAIMVLDAHQSIQLCNHAFDDLFQFSPGEAIGKNLGVLLPGDESPVEARHSSAGAPAGQPLVLVTRRRRNDGALVDV